ncbi:MAG: polysaccharide lyase [Opitutaceae bacterium]|nr:polysaccharide lyase [Opitutaceae bacterium]
MKARFNPLCLVASVALAAAPLAHAQYPQIKPKVRAESDARKAAADRRSDEAFARAMPEIEAWAVKGRPYVPGAAKPADLLHADIPAFPGAQGGGMYSLGGRGGRVFVVTNLNDSGPGSFREACEAGGPRIVVFNVAGIIRLKERIRIRAPYITISGATAPGDGVCIAGDTVELETHDIVIRHMRFRRGEIWVGDRNDSIGGNPIGNVMIDHVSASWGLDENMSMYRHMYQPPGGGRELKLPTVNITIQNSIFSEALNTFHHAFGSTIGGYNATFHHNLWACNTGRNPSVGMIYDFTFANNVLFNWRHRTVDGGDHRSFYTIVNNVFKPGPGTPTDDEIAYRILKPEARRAKPPVDDYGKAYVAGNVVEGNERVTADNWDGGVQPDTMGPRAAVLEKIRQNSPYPHAYLEIQPAREAYELVLAQAGATLPRRDAVDLRVIEMVRTGQVGERDVASVRADIGDVGFQDGTIAEITEAVRKGFITNPAQVGGYPQYTGAPYLDADGDGMPDAWEATHGLNPKDASDASGDLNSDGYTNIEDFINGLDPRAPKQTWPTPRTYEDLWGFLDDKAAE